MERCGKMIKGLGMSEARPCMRSRHYLGGHRPDLTGLEFKYLKVISPGGYRQFSGGGRAFTWVVQHKLSGRKKKNTLAQVTLLMAVQR